MCDGWDGLETIEPQPIQVSFDRLRIASVDDDCHHSKKDTSSLAVGAGGGGGKRDVFFFAFVTSTLGSATRDRHVDNTINDRSPSR